MIKLFKVLPVGSKFNRELRHAVSWLTADSLLTDLLTIMQISQKKVS